jgi:hypothetical protein
MKEEIIMYIDFLKLGQGLLIFFGILVLIMLTIVLLKFINTISSINSIIKKNETNIHEVLSTLPKTSKNLQDISVNIKDVTEAVSLTTLEATKSFERYLVYIVDILTIIKKIFSNKK